MRTPLIAQTLDPSGRSVASAPVAAAGAGAADAPAGPASPQVDEPFDQDVWDRSVEEAPLEDFSDVAPTLVDDVTCATAEPLVWVLPQVTEAGPISQGLQSGSDTVGDPGSLAKDVARISSRDFGEYRPSIVGDVIEVGRLVVGVAALRGASHYDRGQVRQDAVDVAITENGVWFIACVADGVSQATHSHLGADSVASIAVEVVRRALASYDGAVNGIDWNELVSEVRARFEQRMSARITRRLAASPDGAPETLSATEIARAVGTTCEVVVIATEPGPEGTFDFVHVVVAGDGACMVMNRSLGWRTIRQGKDAGAAVKDSTVVPLPIASGEPIITSGVATAGDAVLLTTDGIGEALGDGGGSVGAYLLDRLGQPCGVVDLLHALTFVRKYCTDDRSAAVIWCRES